jgi:hypothetical protein
MAREPVPRPVLIYGLLGLLPFLAPPVVVVAWPPWGGLAVLVQALYAGLILSFLGGVRWGFAVKQAPISATTITLSMTPTLAALAIVTVFAHAPRLELAALALALTAHWAWDLRALTAPVWFPRLRTILTLGAVAGLLAGALVVG